MKQIIRGFIGRINGLKRFQKVLIAVGLIVLVIVGKVCSAQFIYSELGYKPAETTQEYRNALSVSPFTATAFNNGYNYEYDDKQITNIEELEQLYIDKGATEMFVRIATKRHVTDKDETDGVADSNANVHTFDQAIELCKLAAKLNIPINPGTIKNSVHHPLKNISKSITSNASSPSKTPASTNIKPHIILLPVFITSHPCFKLYHKKD